jgi:hypothetical protein
LEAELIADGQDTTVVIPFKIVTLLVQLGNSSCTTEVKCDTVLELVRETNGE